MYVFKSSYIIRMDKFNTALNFITFKWLTFIYFEVVERENRCMGNPSNFTYSESYEEFISVRTDY